MGLDIVEYVMAVEEAFQITFDDADLERTSTVGEFHQLALREIRATYPPTNSVGGRRAICASSRAFYRLRKALVQCGFGTRKEIAPKTPLDCLIPRENRRVCWEQLAVRIKCAMPSLERTNTLCWTLFAGSALLALCPVVLGLIHSIGAIAAWLVFSTAGFYALLIKVSQPLAVEFPLHRRTVGDLVEWFSCQKADQFCRAGAAIDRSGSLGHNLPSSGRDAGSGTGTDHA